jgi:hypothetical protein
VEPRDRGVEHEAHVRLGGRELMTNSAIAVSTGPLACTVPAGQHHRSSHRTCPSQGPHTRQIPVLARMAHNHSRHFTPTGC